MDLKQHPLSAAWPLITGPDFEGLCSDIGANGVREPIVLFEGMVLDGWNRYRAGKAVGVHVPSQLLPAGVDPVAWVWSHNDARRHLTTSQRALAAAEMAAWSRSPSALKADEISAQSALKADEPSRTVEAMAAEAGVSKRTMERARTIVAKAVDPVVQAVRQGEISANTGAEIAQLPAAKQVRALTRAADPKPTKPEKPVKATKPAEDMDPDGPSIEDLLDAESKTNHELRVLLAAAEADDKKAALIKLQRQLDNAVREQGLAMDNAAKASEREARASRWLARCGKAVGESDLSKIPAAVEAFVREHKVAA